MFGFSKSDVELEPPINKCPSHTRRVFVPSELRDVAEWATRHVNELRPDAIVACGHSGLLLAGVLSYNTGTPIFAVRKPNEYTVAGSEPVSGIAMHGKSKRWLWLDDMISTGSTLRRSAVEVYDAGLVKEPFPIAALLYCTYKSEQTTSSLQTSRIADDTKWKGLVPNGIRIIGYLE